MEEQYSNIFRENKHLHPGINIKRITQYEQICKKFYIWFI